MPSISSSVQTLRTAFFLSVLDAPSAKNQVSTVVTATVVHQRAWFDKAFMHLQTQNATLRLIPSAWCCGGHSSKFSWTWSEQTGSLFRSTRWDKGFHGCIRSLVDRGDSGHQFLKWVMDCLRWMIQVVLRPQQTQGCVLQKKRFGGWTNFWLAQLLSTVEQGRSAIIGLLAAHHLHLPDSAYGCCLTFRRL